MHILLANQWYPPESGWGGVAMWNYAVARAYRDLGHQVTVVTMRQRGDMPASEVRDGIRVVRLRVSDAYRWRRLPLLGRYVRSLQQVHYAWRVDRALRRLHKETPFDVVEFAEVNAEGCFYARQPLTPVVVRCHTPTFLLRRYYTVREMPFDTCIISACEKDLIRRAHALTTPSRDLAHIIASECRVPLEDIAVIPNALPNDGWQSPGSTAARSTQVRQPADKQDRSLIVLHVGRLERVKGVSVLADAIPLVVSQVAGVRFVFVGDDLRTAAGTSQRAELESVLSQAGVGAQVEFLGGIDHAALKEWYQRADICVVPSLLYESFSYTCAQAMAAGKPVIATRIGGIPETVDDGISGMIVEPSNAVLLADAIVRLARDPDLRQRMGQAGRTKAEHQFSSLSVAQQNLDVFARAIARVDLRR